MPQQPLWRRGLRATSGGLAQIVAPEGTLISFATQPGNVAQDGSDGDSPYTKALAQTIRKPGLGIFDVFNEVGLAVKKQTGGAQQPWLSSSPIAGSFHFADRIMATQQEILAVQQNISVNIMLMEACRASWNNHLKQQSLGLKSAMISEPEGKPFTLDTAKGKKYIYATNALPETEICGWYFIPFESSKDDQLEAQAQIKAIALSKPALVLAGSDILIVDLSKGPAIQQQLSYNSHFMEGVNKYKESISRARDFFKISTRLSIERLPVTSPPKVDDLDSDRDSQWDQAFGAASETLWKLRKQVAEGMIAFDRF